MAKNEPFFEKLVDRTPYRAIWAAAAVGILGIAIIVGAVAWATGSIKQTWRDLFPTQLQSQTIRDAASTAQDEGSKLLDQAQQKAQETIDQKKQEAAAAAAQAVKDEASKAAQQAADQAQQQLKNLTATPTPTPTP
jgi:F0F1-type ATP synthase membrane subunit b/b'